MVSSCWKWHLSLGRLDKANLKAALKVKFQRGTRQSGQHQSRWMDSSPHCKAKMSTYTVGLVVAWAPLQMSNNCPGRGTKTSLLASYRHLAGNRFAKMPLVAKQAPASLAELRKQEGLLIGHRSEPEISMYRDAGSEFAAESEVSGMLLASNVQMKLIVQWMSSMYSILVIVRASSGLASRRMIGFVARTHPHSLMHNETLGRWIEGESCHTCIGWILCRGEEVLTSFKMRHVGRHGRYKSTIGFKLTWNQKWVYVDLLTSYRCFDGYKIEVGLWLRLGSK